MTRNTTRRHKDRHFPDHRLATSAAALKSDTPTTHGVIDAPADAAINALDWKPSSAHAAEAAGQPGGSPLPSGGLLGMLGHGEACVALAKAGRIASCDCRTSDMDDPAVAVALALHYGRMARTRRLPVPAVVIELLAMQVREGDAACRAAGEWLDGCGLLDIACDADQGSRQ